MDTEALMRLEAAVSLLVTSGVDLERIYHLGADWEGSRPWHSGGVAFDWQGMRIAGEDYVMDPGARKLSFPGRPAVWLKVDAALRLYHTFVLGYPYPEHHNHFHTQPTLDAFENWVWDPGRAGKSSTMALQQHLNWHLQKTLNQPLMVDGGLGPKTLEHWSSHAGSKITRWDSKMFLKLLRQTLALGTDKPAPTPPRPDKDPKGIKGVPMLVIPNESGPAVLIPFGFRQDLKDLHDVLEFQQDRNPIRVGWKNERGGRLYLRPARSDEITPSGE
jgi:hypothetical protein